MSPVSRKTGRTYAAGSQATWSPGDSLVCCHCGGKLRITVDTIWLHFDARSGVHASSHVGCGSPLEAARA